MRALLIFTLLIAQLSCSQSEAFSTNDNQAGSERAATSVQPRAGDERAPVQLAEVSDVRRPRADTEHRRALARGIVSERINTAWLRSGMREPLNLILLDCDERGRVFRDELRRVFPEGVSHLPETLTPRVIYCRTPTCERAIQHIGKAREGGFTFAVMRFYPTAQEMERLGR